MASAPSPKGRRVAPTPRTRRPEVVRGGGHEALALDRLIHERTRLGMLSALAVHPVLRFGELKGLLKTSDGNLSVHARRLEEAGYVDCEKGFEGRVPRTEFRITAAGRKALEGYLRHMEAIIKSTRA